MTGLARPDLGVGGLVLVCAAILASFAALSWSASLGSTAARALAVAQAALLFVGAWVWVVAAGVVAAGCQENCAVAGVAADRHWWRQRHAWQQDAQLAVAVLGLVLLLLALRQTMLGRHRSAVGLVAGAALCLGAWTAVVAPLGNGFGI